MFVARYSSDGVIDTSFGTNGYFLTNFMSNGGHAYGLALQNDEKIIVVGATNNNALARCQPAALASERPKNFQKRVKKF